jgi:hypothetical protein
MYHAVAPASVATAAALAGVYFVELLLEICSEKCQQCKAQCERDKLIATDCYSLLYTICYMINSNGADNCYDSMHTPPLHAQYSGLMYKTHC